MAPEASGGGMIRKGWTSDGATISECGSYRYWLGRSRNGGDGRVTFIMLNSSDADAERDDPTIRRCLGFAEAWGKRQFVALNLFGWRDSDPMALLRCADPIGPENDAYLLKAEGLVVCAWGTGGTIRSRSWQVRQMLMASGLTLHHLGLTKHGYPKHPLYLRGDLMPMVWA